MSSKLKIIIPVVALVLVGVAYKTVLTKPAPVHKPKVEGMVYVLPKDFLVNLKGGRFARFTVGLVLAHDALPAEAGGEAGAEPPEGFGPLPQEALVRALVTDSVTGRSSAELMSQDGREAIKRRLKRLMLRRTDVPVHDVLLPDVALQ